MCDFMRLHLCTFTTNMGIAIDRAVRQGVTLTTEPLNPKTSQASGGCAREFDPQQPKDLLPVSQSHNTGHSVPTSLKGKRCFTAQCQAGVFNDVANMCTVHAQHSKQACRSINLSYSAFSIPLKSYYVFKKSFGVRTWK